MKIKHWLMTASVAFVLLGAPALAADKDAKAAAERDPSETYKLLSLFGDVFEKVRADYVEEPGDDKLIESALNGMLTALDPHSSYLNAKNYREMQVQTKGEFGGLGIQVTMENSLVKVISPIDDTPAHRAGVLTNDFITHINGEPVLGMTLNDAVDKMRGPVGSDIKLTLRRQGRDPFDVTLTRAIIKIDSVRSRVEGDVGYLRITQFNEHTESGLKKEIDKLAKTAPAGGYKGYVLDLRNNPGGLLDQAIAVSDAFLDKGEIVSTRSRKPEETQRYNARSGDLLKGKPLVVLINAGSASASEIVAGALQDHHRATLVGTKSFGKGSVQTIIPLGTHGAMRLTTARYYTPSGRSIQQVGIEPDVVVEAAKPEGAKTAGEPRREADLRGALENPGDNGLSGKKDGASKDKAKDAPKDKPKGQDQDQEADADGEPPPGQDNQLARALEILRAPAPGAKATK